MRKIIVPVILCGGSGTRLWPLSRQTYPKQFLRLFGERSLLQETILRLPRADEIAAPLLVAGESTRFIVAEQMREIGEETAQILLEPSQRNTAPAIASAALHAQKYFDNPLLLVLPADHIILNGDAFWNAVTTARSAAENGELVTFGIRPHRAETGYGYIRFNSQSHSNVSRVEEFVEKPDRETAKRYLETGAYYWNSGMFLLNAQQFLNELESFEPNVFRSCKEAVANSREDGDFVRLDGAAYARSPEIAIDYAVMERTKNASMVHLDAGWSDIGCWASVRDVASKDEHGNGLHGDVVAQDSEGCFVHSTGRLVTMVGMKNTVVVETADAVLVMDATKAQEAKKLVSSLVEAGRSEATEHREVFRPWGSYDSIGKGDRFQVKRITVKPGAKLSLQMHHHRAEHWVVVSGTAKITNGEREYLLTENQSTYIEVGIRHSLENPGKIPLELIEIQSGGYLGEDDIVRFEDRYGRANGNPPGIEGVQK